MLQWEVPFSLDGRTAILNGTIQDVYRQLLKINRNYEVEFGSVDKSWGASASASARTGESFRVLENRERSSWSDCGHFDPAKADAVWEGINHLSHVSGVPVSIPGPGVCGRVSCSYNSAIWWCNDVSWSLSLLSSDLKPGLITQLHNGVQFELTGNALG